MPLQPLPGTVQQAPAGLQGCDVNQVLSARNCQQLLNAGYQFAIRYLPRNSSDESGCLTNDEALTILNSGLALMAVQHVAPSPWTPSGSLGTQYGSFVAQYAANTVGLPPGMNIWLDLEGISGVASSDVIDYCQNWYAAVFNAGYVPGVYVGWGTELSSKQLYDDLSFQHYWSAYNNDTEVATRGFQLIQATNVPVDGLQVEVDPDTTQNDNLGGACLWLAVSNPAV